MSALRRRSLTKAGLFVILGGMSLSLSLQSVAIYLILGYFNLGTSLLLGMLVLGFPIGAMAATRLWGDEVASFNRAAAVAQVIAFLDMAAVFIAKYVSPTLEMGLLERSSLWSILLNTGALCLLFLPFFTAWGLFEYQGYRVAKRALNHGAGVVYAIYLLSLAAGYFLARWIVLAHGVATLLLLALLLGAIVSIYAEARGRGQRIAAAVIVIGTLATPRLEQGFISFIRGTYQDGGRTVDVSKDLRFIHAQWDLTYLLSFYEDPLNGKLVGFYNNYSPWSFDRKSSITQPFHPYGLVPEGGEVCIIGAGGGRQISQALSVGIKKIVAIELRTLVVRLLTGSFSHLVDDVWNAPGVRAVAMDGRRYLEQTDEQFDLITLPHVDTVIFSTKSVFDASDRMHTVEAFQVMYERLKPGGLITVQKSIRHDRKLELFNRIFRNMQAADLVPYGAVSERGYIILGVRKPDEERRAQIDALAPQVRSGVKLIREVPSTAAPLVHDDRPYEVGPPSLVLTTAFMKRLFVVMLGFALLIVVLLSLGLKKEVPRPFYGSPGSLAFVAGFNFIIIESELIFRLLRYLNTPLDGFYLGVIGCSLLAGLGAGLNRYFKGRSVVALGVVAVGGVIAWQDATSITGFFMLIPALTVAGMFFPRAFDALPGGALGAFAMDAAGAFAGGVCALFFPIVFGFGAYTTLVGASTALAIVLVVRLDWESRNAALEMTGLRYGSARRR